MPRIKVGDRVEYRYKSSTAPGGDPAHNGQTGTVTAILGRTFIPHAQVDWDGNTGLRWLEPFLENLVPITAPVTPITTEYETDSHHDVLTGDDSDPVAHPSHYTSGVYEVWRVIRDWKLNFNRGSAVKYIARAGKKDDELQDLRKARQFLDFEIEALEAERKAV
jgi:hypothetical protein